MAEQELRSRITVEGGDQGAKEIEKVSKATEKLTEASREVQRVAVEVIRERTESALGSAKSAGAAGLFAVAIGKIALALRATLTVFKLLPSAGAVVAGVLSIVDVLKQEVAERLRLARVMKLQGEAQDELQGKQRDQRQTLEGVSDRRRFGGFDAGTSRRVQAQGAAARAEFSQLGEEAVTTALGTFGGLGLSQRDLTDLAIAQQTGNLDVDPQALRSPDAARRLAQRTLKRVRRRGVIDRFAERESVQGEGLGRAEFRPAVTDAAQELAAQSRGAGGGDVLLREAIAKAIQDGTLPADTDVERAIRLIQGQATAGELEGAQVGFASGRPLTTLFNRLRLRPTTEVGLENQPGFVNQALESVGITKEFEELPLDEFEGLVKLKEQIEQGALPRGGAGGGNTTINIVNNNNQGQRVVSPSARTQQKVIENGGNALSNRELVGVG